MCGRYESARIAATTQKNEWRQRGSEGDGATETKGTNKTDVAKKVTAEEKS